jgi:hypothetical protein
LLKYGIIYEGSISPNIEGTSAYDTESKDAKARRKKLLSEEFQNM